MNNYDELILRRRRIDRGAPFPPLHQAVRIALYDRYAARSFYLRVAEAFGARAPFPAMAKSAAGQVEALAALADRFGIPRPLDPFPVETTVAPAWSVNCRRAVAGEMAAVQLLAQLAAQLAEADARRTLLQVRETSLGRHLPAFEQALADAYAHETYHAAKGVTPQQAYVRHGPLSDFMERALSQLGGQLGPIGVLSPLLRSAHPALLAGLAAGGAGAFFLQQKRRRNRKEN